MSAGPERRHPRRHLDPGPRSAEVRLPGGRRRAESVSPLQRFRRAVAEMAALAPPADLATIEQLATAPVRAVGAIVYASNAVFLLELDAPDPHLPGQPMRAIYKPARGERPLWDFPHHTLHLRERAAYLLSAGLGAEVVPPTALRDGPHGPGSVQLFVHPREEALTEPQAADLERQLRRVAVFDVLANNADRKRAHLLVDGAGHVWGIDNALTFLPYPRQRTVLLELGGSDLDPDDADLVRRLCAPEAAGSLRRALLGLLSAAEVHALERRVRQLAADPWYPRLDDWDGRPFEWW